ncbi:hypothetical protein [Nocardioides sp.]|uniref:hypothetical protein n=1 Tax=Nocardioides sp. TaxID=35761 RepID=UPI0031FF1E60|nr:hypothetical protein [Nocardioides sp.]
MARSERPVLTGLAALVGVGILVGLFLGVAALAGTQLLGINSNGASAGSTSAESLYLPKPSRTRSPSGPLITLAPDPSGTSSPSDQPTEQQTPDKAISLSSGQTQVGQMEQIDLTGVYPGGEGAILQVQRFQGGTWTDFPVTASVSNETFSTYVQTSQLGRNRFRVVDTDTGLESNEVRIQVG